MGSVSWVEKGRFPSHVNLSKSRVSLTTCVAVPHQSSCDTHGPVILLHKLLGEGLEVVGNRESNLISERLKVLAAAVDLRLLSRPEGVGKQANFLSSSL